jgi:hypothetical protein
MGIRRGAGVGLGTVLVIVLIIYMRGDLPGFELSERIGPSEEPTRSVMEQCLTEARRVDMDP